MSKNASKIERMLGSDVVSNPNRWSKTCCTVDGEEWGDNYNKGENAEKYLRCWEPNAPEELNYNMSSYDMAERSDRHISGIIRQNLPERCERENGRSAHTAWNCLKIWVVR